MGLAAVACSPSVAASAADDRDDVIAAAVERAVRPLLAAHDVPGMAVGITVRGRSRVFAYGVASRRTNAPVTGDTLFEIGSLSKALTATAGAYAKARGRLALDDRAGLHMPSLQGTPIGAARLVDLATYVAGGLPLQFPVAVGTDAEMVEYFRRWRPSAAAGAQRRYSNPSVGLFGRIAALSMGRGYAYLLEGEIFPRLGLARSYIRVPEGLMQDHADGHDGSGTVRMSPGMLDAEAYGVKSTAADMIRFVEANIAPGGLEPPIRQAVEETQIGRFQVGPMVQGLGWEQYAYPVGLERLLAGNAARMALEPHDATRLDPPRAPSGPTLYNKTGSTRGFGAYAAFVPRSRIGIVILANRNLPIPARIRAAHSVLDMLDRFGGEP